MLITLDLYGVLVQYIYMNMRASLQKMSNMVSLRQCQPQYMNHGALYICEYMNISVKVQSNMHPRESELGNDATHREWFQFTFLAALPTPEGVGIWPP